MTNQPKSIGCDTIVNLPSSIIIYQITIHKSFKQHNFDPNGKNNEHPQSNPLWEYAFLA